MAISERKPDWDRDVQEMDTAADPFTFTDSPAEEAATTAEMSRLLEDLICLPKLGNACWDFGSLVNGVRRVMKVNPHQHMTGSVGDIGLLRRVIKIYREDAVVGDRFLDYISSRGMIAPSERKAFFQRTDTYLVKWLESRLSIGRDPGGFPECDQHLDMARLAFQSQHPDSPELFRQAYRTVALENLTDGVSEVWFRTTLGDQADGRYARAALVGAKEAECESGGRLKVRFLAGTRKILGETEQDGFSSSTSALTLLQENSDDQTMVLGIDSVGMDSNWRPEQQAFLRHEAASRKLRVAVHFAESWAKGALLETLERLEQLVTYGVIDNLDNANGLFAVQDEAAPVSHYSTKDWKAVAGLQHQVLQVMIQRRITLGINPMSNDLLTRSLRRGEGWRFRRFNEPLGAGLPPVLEMMSCEEESNERLRVVVGNDNSRFYPSRIDGAYLTVSEELASLWAKPGQSNGSVFGHLPTNAIARVILNGLEMAKSVDRELLLVPARARG